MTSRRLSWFGLFALAFGGCGGGAHDPSHDPHAGHSTASSPEPAAGGSRAGHEGHDGHDGHEAMAATAPSTADTSLFQLTTAFTDQDGGAFAFESLRGHPTLIAMFYGSCETMCPILLEDVRAIDEALAPELRARTRILLVTFDPARDTAERLRSLIGERHFDPARTRALRGDDPAIRELSMVLGVQYRRLPDGNFSHSALITLLDPEGLIVERLEGLRAPNEPMLARLRAMP